MSEDEERPVCPGCGKAAEDGTYPARRVPEVWWCSACLQARVEAERNE